MSNRSHYHPWSTPAIAARPTGKSLCFESPALALPSSNFPAPSSFCRPPPPFLFARRSLPTPVSCHRYTSFSLALSFNSSAGPVRETRPLRALLARFLVRAQQPVPRRVLPSSILRPLSSLAAARRNTIPPGKPKAETRPPSAALRRRTGNPNEAPQPGFQVCAPSRHFRPLAAMVPTPHRARRLLPWITYGDTQDLVGIPIPPGRVEYNFMPRLTLRGEGFARSCRSTMEDSG